MKSRSFLRSGELKLFVTLTIILTILLVFTLIAEGNSKKNAETVVPAQVNPFSNVVISAKAAYVYDVRTKEVLYAKNEEARLPLASLTKVMSALVATDLSGSDSVIIITPEALSADGDSGLLVGERWKLKDLLDFSLTTSSNDGIKAVALSVGAKVDNASTTGDAEKSFVREMNAKADELQMKNTYYFNETGLDLPANAGETLGKGGGYGSAHDMAKLFEYVLSTHSDLLEATQDEKFTISSLDAPHTAHNTDVLANIIPGLKASKTGFTDLAGGNLVIAFDPELDRPVIISVLGSTESGRFKDMTTLVNKALEKISADAKR
jgi:D-alanyl-D-alanine carboxypeptidase (penicillin-binding protein 5/6)